MLDWRLGVSRALIQHALVRPCDAKASGAFLFCRASQSSGAAMRENHTMTDHAKSQAYAQLDNVKELVAAVRSASEAGDWGALEEASQAIHEDALSVEVRDGWRVPGAAECELAEYRILLCTGGPAVQITGDLDYMGHPDTARLQYQDWGTPWTDLTISDDDEQVLIEYAAEFLFDR